VTADAAIAIRPIGRVRSTRVATGDDGWDAEQASIELDDAFEPDALAGLETFSHAEIFFVFDRVAEDAVERGARHPRGNPDWPRVGIFAQRGKDRPNRLGATIVEIVSRSGRTLVVHGLDAVHELVDLLAADGLRLTGVLATHWHPDHAGGNEQARGSLVAPAEIGRVIDDARGIAVAPFDGDFVAARQRHDRQVSRGALMLQSLPEYATEIRRRDRQVPPPSRWRRHRPPSTAQAFPPARAQ